MCLLNGMTYVDVLQHLLMVTINDTSPRKSQMNNYEHPKFIWGGNTQLNCKIWGKMALSVYESNTNQRFVTSLIKTTWRCLCDHICKLHSVLGFMSSPSKLNGSLDCSKQISYPAVLIELVFRLELGLCWLKIALEQEHWIWCFNRAVKLNHYEESHMLMKFWLVTSLLKRELCFFHTTNEFGERKYSPTKKLKEQTLSTILGLISVYYIKVPARFQIPVNL